MRISLIITAARTGTTTTLCLVQETDGRTKKQLALQLDWELRMISVILFVLLAVTGSHSRELTRRDLDMMRLYDFPMSTFADTIGAERREMEPNCPPHPFPVPLPDPLPPVIQTALSRLENQIKATINTDTVPAVSVSLVYMGSEIWSRGYGVKSKTGFSDPPDHDTIFRIGSISKVFSAMVMYQLYDRGLVRSLDDPLSDYCHGFSMLNPFNSQNITLRQIASQMSGLPREAPCTVAIMEDGTINACPQTTDEILDRLQYVSLMFPTWTLPSYSNLGFSLLGHCLVEHFFPNMTYEEYVSVNILQPLELNNTGFNMTESVVEKMAVGYWIPVFGQESEEAPLIDLGWIGPTGQMYSTTADLNKMVAFFTSANGEDGSDPVHPEVLSGDTRREMQLQVYVNRDQRTGFGTPWEIRFQANYTVLRKGGNVPGHSSIISFVPELQLGLNMLWSGAFDEFDASNAAYDYLIPAFVEYLMTVQPPYPYPPDPEVYEGMYDFGPFEAEVRTSRNRLLLRSPIVTFGGSLILAYKEPLRFQLAYPDHLQTCLIAQLVSRRKAFVVFQPPLNSTSPSPGFTIPGAFPGWQFQRRP